MTGLLLFIPFSNKRPPNLKNHHLRVQSDNYDDFLKRVFEGKANFDWDTPPDVSGGPSSSDGGKTGTTDDTTTSLPPVPWSDFLLQAKDIEFSKDETTGERIVLGSGRYGTVYQGKLAGAETVAIKCINTAKVPGGSAISKVGVSLFRCPVCIYSMYTFR